MEKAEVLKKFKNIVSGCIGVELTEIKLESKFSEDLGTDSLDNIEIIMDCEKEFGITIEDDKAEKIKTVSEAVDFIHSLL